MSFLYKKVLFLLSWIFFCFFFSNTFLLLSSFLSICLCFPFFQLFFIIYFVEENHFYVSLVSFRSMFFFLFLLASTIVVCLRFRPINAMDNNSLFFRIELQSQDLRLKKKNAIFSSFVCRPSHSLFWPLGVQMRQSDECELPVKELWRKMKRK